MSTQQHDKSVHATNEGGDIVDGAVGAVEWLTAKIH